MAFGQVRTVCRPQTGPGATGGLPLVAPYSLYGKITNLSGRVIMGVERRADSDTWGDAGEATS